MQRSISEHQLNLLRLYSDSTYGIALDYEEAKELEAQGLVQWVPPLFGTTQWAITEKGKQVVREARFEASVTKAIDKIGLPRSSGGDAGAPGDLEGHS